jgi:RNA polymerase sigma-70 factor (ECF subfamily)
MSLSVAVRLPLPRAVATVGLDVAREDRGMQRGGFDVRAAYAAHGSDLLGFAVNALHDRGLAEECVQETFTRAWRARDRFDPARAGERTWLFAIARNVVLDAVRARGRRPATAAADHAGSVPAADDDLPQVLDHLTLVWALAQLSEEHRRVVVAVRLEGWSYDELARRDGTPVATLRTRMYHALRALRAILEEQEDPT